MYVRDENDEEYLAERSGKRVLLCCQLDCYCTVLMVFSGPARRINNHRQF